MKCKIIMTIFLTVLFGSSFLRAAYVNITNKTTEEVCGPISTGACANMPGGIKPTNSATFCIKPGDTYRSLFDPKLSRFTGHMDVNSSSYCDLVVGVPVGKSGTKYSYEGLNWQGESFNSTNGATWDVSVK